MAPWSQPGASLDATEELARTNLALPMSPALTGSQTDEVVDAVATASAGSVA
jgi:dTDP-4-amino-4,6-dideoxygalactose transaminase